MTLVGIIYSILFTKDNKHMEGITERESVKKTSSSEKPFVLKKKWQKVGKHRKMGEMWGRVLFSLGKCFLMFLMKFQKELLQECKIRCQEATVCVSYVTKEFYQVCFREP